MTATDPRLLQAPFRAGIKIDAYQLEPLRKALRMPRVNLLIADDVGLGKTIEAGLIARELLLRRRVERIVVAVPPSMLTQWQEELEARFGLVLPIIDREHLAGLRRERGFGTNPWNAGTRHLISHKLLIDEAYTADLHSALGEGEFAPKSLLILDEAHHAAPASGARYAIDSQLTRAVRELARRFEHRLFLSATPHNGHSNSFSALLEMLDPQRFCRGIPVRKGQLDAVVVRRLKDDLRALRGGFPERKVEQVDIDGLPADAPELRLPELLGRYRDLVERRLAGESRTRRAAALLSISTLQQRLLSSVAAFASTLERHRRSVEKALATQPTPPVAGARAIDRLSAGLAAQGADDEPEPVDETEQDRLDEAARLAFAGLPNPAAELGLLAEMAGIAEVHRREPDRRVLWLLGWIDENMCPGLLKGRPGARWNERRLLIFTEWEETRRWLEGHLRDALAATERGDERMAVFTGSTPPERREAIKHAFNAAPGDKPLRILVCTDAAREGLNLQRHCRDLVHLDLPWNPSRIEQRNGRIDRKLQPAPVVTCRYFHLPQRPEDRVLLALVRKTETIRKELGSLAQVLEARLAGGLRGGIERGRAASLAAEIERASLDGHRATVEDELEAGRERREQLEKTLEQLRRQLERSEKAIGLEVGQLRDAVSTSLRLAGAQGLATLPDAKGNEGQAIELFAFPAGEALAADPRWAGTLDTLRPRRDREEPEAAWRRRPVRPVTFHDPDRLGEEAVQLHLEHRVVRRLLGRLTAQGLLEHDLSRACLASGRSARRRVVLLGRLALYGPGAARLHEELVPVTATWTELGQRRGPLQPLGETGEEDVLAELDAALDEAGRRPVPAAAAAILLEAASVDIAQLRPHLEHRADSARATAERRLAERATKESDDLRSLMLDLERRLAERLRVEVGQLELDLRLTDLKDRRQLEAERKGQRSRLEAIRRDLEREPARVREQYEVKAWRLEPVGLAYLWPATG